MQSFVLQSLDEGSNSLGNCIWRNRVSSGLFLSRTRLGFCRTEAFGKWFLLHKSPAGRETAPCFLWAARAGCCGMGDTADARFCAGAVQGGDATSDALCWGSACICCMPRSFVGNAAGLCRKLRHSDDHCVHSQLLLLFNHSLIMGHGLREGAPCSSPFLLYCCSYCS